MYRFRVEHLKKKECYPKLMEEHELIIEMIEKRRKKEACEIIGKHIDNQVITVSDVIREKK